MVADVQGSKGGGEKNKAGGQCVASVVMGDGLMCVCVHWGRGGGVTLNDLFIKFTIQKPAFVCWASVEHYKDLTSLHSVYSR